MGNTSLKSEAGENTPQNLQVPHLPTMSPHSNEGPREVLVKEELVEENAKIQEFSIYNITMWFKHYIYATNKLWRMKTKTNREEEAQREDHLSVNIWTYLNLANSQMPIDQWKFYTVNIYWRKKKYNEHLQNLTVISVLV